MVKQPPSQGPHKCFSGVWNFPCTQPACRLFPAEQESGPVSLLLDVTLVLPGEVCRSILRKPLRGSDSLSLCLEDAGLCVSWKGSHVSTPVTRGESTAWETLTDTPIHAPSLIALTTQGLKGSQSVMWPNFWSPSYSLLFFVSTASPLPGPDMAMKPGAGLPPFTALPFVPPTPVPPDQPLWEPSPQPPMPPAFSAGNPLLLSAFPSPLLVTGEGGSGPSVAGTGQVIVKVKTEVGPAESSQTQNRIVTQTALNWITSGAPCGGQEGPPPPPPRYVTASNVKTILPAVAVGVSQEGLAGLPLQPLPPPAAQLAPIVPLEKSWPGTQAAAMEGGPVAARKPSQGDLAYASKGVYENYRRWQRYKVLARTHLSQSPDAEALSCFLM